MSGVELGSVSRQSWHLTPVFSRPQLSPPGLGFQAQPRACRRKPPTARGAGRPCQAGRSPVSSSLGREDHRLEFHPTPKSGFAAPGARHTRLLSPVLPEGTAPAPTPPTPRPLLRTNSENGTMPPATPSLDSPPGPCSRLLRRETGPHFRPGSRGALCPDLALPSRQSWGSRGRTGTAQEQWGGSPGSASCLICPHVCRCVPVLFFKEQGLDLGGRAPSRGTPSPCGLSCHARSSSLKRTTHAGRSCPPARSAAALRRARC